MKLPADLLGKYEFVEMPAIAGVRIAKVYGNVPHPLRGFITHDQGQYVACVVVGVACTDLRDAITTLELLPHAVKADTVRGKRARPVTS